MKLCFLQNVKTELIKLARDQNEVRRKEWKEAITYDGYRCC